jgi:hypothetical protein
LVKLAGIAVLAGVLTVVVSQVVQRFVMGKAHASASAGAVVAVMMVVFLIGRRKRKPG